MSDIVCVQFREGGKPQNYLSNDLELKTNALCVVETEHGPAVARVVRPHRVLSERKQLPGPLRRVLRLATPRDLELIRTNDRLEREAYRLCGQKIEERQLPMKLVDVNYTLEGRKAVFYFTAENRVDFRELVKDLAQVLRVKIEMRQIGVRDEARRLGGVGACGRTLCCCTFLRDFVSVSIRMAKDQNVSLNPTKVSGICGRLMCCLSYEYDPSKPRRKKGEPAPDEVRPNAAGAPGQPGSCAECPAHESHSAPDATRPAGAEQQDRPSRPYDPRRRSGARPGPSAARPGGEGGFRRQDRPPRPGQRPEPPRSGPRPFPGGGDRRGGRPGPNR